ncbi:NAD(P)-dependent oxidoreductase [Sorangium sp. So ce233]|uniref:NAD(P)-dependent oxidoreductase n=1 Tax=Sorangium sp. So ce233 TaxID=3133290 RepID=UPI003F632B16
MRAPGLTSPGISPSSISAFLAAAAGRRLLPRKALARGGARWERRGGEMTTKTTTRVAIIGLGAMGSRMASRLLDAGHELIVYNRSAERAAPLVDRGARRAASPKEAAAGAGVVISMVTDDEASRAVWLDPERGALGGLGAEAIAIESSTLTLDWVRELAEHVGRRGARFLDAPVVGSRPQADAGQLVYLIGGAPETVDAARDVLGVLGAALRHVGLAGSGAVMKLVVNALFGIQVAALAELLGVLRGAGVDRAQALELLGALPVTSPALRGAGALIAADRHEPMFPIDLVEKDFRYALALARDVGASLPTAEAVRRVYAAAQSAGHGGQNIAAVSRIYG